MVFNTRSTTSKCFLNTYMDGDSTTSLGISFWCMTTLSEKKFFLISNLNLPWCKLRPFSLRYLEEEADPSLSTTSFQVSVGSNRPPLSTSSPG